VALRFSASRPRNEANQRCDVCEGRKKASATGVGVTFHAVLELYAGKLARTVLRGPRFREETWLTNLRLQAWWTLSA
jgi:hypothetical protein